MKKLFYFLFLSFLIFIKISISNAWESNISLSCINDNLEPCSNLNLPSNNNIENSNKKIGKIQNIKNKKKVVIKSLKKKDVVSKSFEKDDKILKKSVVQKNIKENKDIKVPKNNIKKNTLKLTSNKIKTNIDFDRNISFEQFKDSVKTYSNNSDFPNINN